MKDVQKYGLHNLHKDVYVCA